MNLNEEQRTQLRCMMLLAMHKAHPMTLSLSMLHTGVKLAGYNLELHELQSEVAALVECKHARVATSDVNLANKNYTRTEAGRVALVEAGLLA